MGAIFYGANPMTQPTHSPELVEAVARALEPGIFTMADQDKKVGATHSAFLEQRIESTLRLARYVLTAAEPFIAARVEVTVEAATAIETLTARIAALVAERAWRPIETAPRDGTMFLGMDSYSEHERVRWEDGRFEDCYGGEWSLVYWQPLPPPPSEETGDGR